MHKLGELAKKIGPVSSRLVDRPVGIVGDLAANGRDGGEMASREDVNACGYCRFAIHTTCVKVTAL